MHQGRPAKVLVGLPAGEVTKRRTLTNDNSFQ